MDRCPFCRSEIETQVQSVRCTDCGSPYHMDCWKINEGCSVFGCRGRMDAADVSIKRVFSAPLLPTVHNMKNLLELNGIKCAITNQYLSAAMGDIPAMECWPQLWVRDDDFAEATELIQALNSREPSNEGTWICENCSEELEGQFTECWNCGADRI